MRDRRRLVHAVRWAVLAAAAGPLAVEASRVVFVKAHIVGLG